MREQSGYRGSSQGTEKEVRIQGRSRNTWRDVWIRGSSQDTGGAVRI